MRTAATTKVLEGGQGFESREKTTRFSGALASAPSARLMELLPLQHLLGPGNGTLLDICSGTGFVSRFFAPRFTNVVRIDANPVLLQCRAPNSTCVLGGAADIDTFEALRGSANAAVCLASLHHILGYRGTRLDLDLTTETRGKALKLWARSLRPGGRLVVADVARCDNSTSLRDLPAREIVADATAPATCRLIAATSDTDCQAANVRGDRVCGSIESYLTSVRRGLRRLGCGDPNPAGFFDHFVARKCPAGHTALFSSQDELVECFEAAGLRNVGSFVAPTPWVFDTEAAAIWFLHELFAIGEDRCRSVTDLDTAATRSIRGAIDDHLGLTRFVDGSCLVWWKLMYAFGDRP